MKSTRLISHLAVAAVLLAAPVAFAQANPSGSGQAAPSEPTQMTPPSSSSQMNSSGTMGRHGTGTASDTELETRVKQALQNDSKLSSEDISVNAKNNVVYLTGTVDNRADRSHAVEVASRVDGVQKVEDKIKVGK